MEPSEPTASVGPRPAVALSDRLRADLSRAMRAHDRPTVSVLRTALAAIANAEAPPAEPTPRGAPAPPPEVGRLVDHPRRMLSAADLDQILRAEVDDRRHTMAIYTEAGRNAEAAAMRDEIVILERYLD